MGEGFITRRGTPPEPIPTIEEGLIVGFYDLSTNIPNGWALCDGQNGTPDLRDMFIVGAGDTYNVEQTGGSSDAVLIEHTHTATAASAGNHSHLITRGEGSGSGFLAASASGALTDSGTVRSSTNGSHTHTASLNSTGESGTGKNIPPYLSLFYIIKEAG
jgi:microcystin-dependent protein